jgi:hypothetical protein
MSCNKTMSSDGVPPYSSEQQGNDHQAIASMRSALCRVQIPPAQLRTSCCLYFITWNTCRCSGPANPKQLTQRTFAPRPQPTHDHGTRSVFRRHLQNSHVTPS